MVDAIVSLAAQKLTDFLIQEGTFLLGVNDDLEWIKRELIWMQSFLKDAEQKQGTDERIRLWAAEIRTIAFETEDIIDDFYMECKGKEPSKRKLLTTSLQKFFCIAGKTNVYDIGKEIKALKEKLSDITRKREVYDINIIGNDVQEIANAGSQNSLLRDLRRTTSFTDEKHFVGFDDDIVLLTEKLLSNERMLSVISIYGMGGLGKTSLAKKLYNTVNCRFELHAWVCVSQEWNTRDLLEKIIKSLKELTYGELKMLEKMNDDNMKRYLQDLLKDTRYLVVIDDMWDKEAWKCLKSDLPDNRNRSRVIITTRSKLVADLSDERTYDHNLRRLRKDESWNLFCKNAFSNQNGACSQELAEIGKEMVEKCDGLPLAIIVLGGLLLRKKSGEWRVIRKRIWRALIDKSVHISALFDLSYSDLTHDLMLCFLYLGIFPKDYEIGTEKLVQMWIAEDLIPPSEGRNPEECAESYIKELNARSLIQLTRSNYQHNSTCRVHDILQDLAMKKAKELDFFHIYGESLNPTTEQLSAKRIAFRLGFERYMAIDDHSYPRVHSLSFLNYKSLLDDGDVTKLLTFINTQFESLRVLDLEGVKIETTESKLKLSKAMEKLVHLKYLGLIHTDLDGLPESIGDLRSLPSDMYVGITQEKAYAGSQDLGLRELRRITPVTDEEHFVGFQNDVKLLETQLLSSELRRSVVSILGMGGLGKTSLARKLYNTNKCRFDLHAWVYVSQQWDTKDLLATIIQSLKQPTYEELNMLEKMNDDDMKRYLHKLLNNKRYLVVIDDIWVDKAWECLRSVLLDNRNGSRVIITTRNESVAKLLDERTYVHKLRRLQEDESWELFCKKAFPNRNSACPEDLEKIGKEIVSKCDGLPLAIIVLGGLLSCKEPHEWIDIKQRIWKALIDRSIHISALLDLSYNDLSPRLKLCFLFLGIFPEDYEIHSEKLIQLWIAEDLIPPYEGLDLEELAESYIKELNARSLIQLSNNDYGPGSTCCVHVLLRDLVVKKAKELDFFHIYEESVSPSIKPFSTRRIAFRSGFERYMAIDHSRTRVHTISFLNYHNRCLDDGDVTKLLTLINTSLKSLRVLDLEGVKIATTQSELKLIKAMGKLIHLRYIGLFQTDIYELPKSIGNLQTLQVLDGEGSTLLPRDMYKFKQLRHLRGYFITKEGDIIVPPTSLENLADLHSLQYIDISGWLTNEESDEFALKAFSKLRNIRNLSVWFEDAEYSLSVEPLFSCKNLIELKLYGSIKSLPMELNKSLPNLRTLTLHKANFVQDPLPALEMLPNLLVLCLEGFKLKSLIITSTGFYKLVSLTIYDIPSDMNLQIEEGALPSLKHISIDPLENFTLPERFIDLSK